MDAYNETIRHTASRHAPWYVVPADNKWFTRIAVAAAIIETLDSLHLHVPELSPEGRAQLEAARAVLEKD